MVRVNVITPEELERLVDLRQIRMRIDVGPQELVGAVPGAVEIVRHDVKPVDTFFDLDNVEMLEIPVGGRDLERKDPMLVLSSAISSWLTRDVL